MKNREHLGGLWGRRLIDKIKAIIAAGGLIVVPLLAIERCEVNIHVDNGPEQQEEAK